MSATLTNPPFRATHERNSVSVSAEFGGRRWNLGEVFSHGGRYHFAPNNTATHGEDAQKAVAGWIAEHEGPINSLLNCQAGVQSCA